MKKKLLVVFICLLSILSLVGCKEINSDAAKFKKEYESLNGTKINGNTVRELDIPKDNPFIYKEASDIIEMMDNKESFVVYFGFAKCPWCRSVLPTLIDVSKNQGLDTIYYVDIYDIRDKLTINENGEVIKETEGSNDYYKLLEYFDEVLSEYELYDSNNEKVETNEKRIYAPNVVSVVDGKPKDLTTGISDKQTDAYMELTEEMIEETYNDFKCIIKCVLDNKNTCSKEKQC